MKPATSVESEDEKDSNSYPERGGFGHGGQGYEPIIQSLDLPFGVAVLHLAFPYIPTDVLQQDQNILPTLFTKKIVAAVVCSDSSVRLVMLPLAPPSTGAKKAADKLFTAANGRNGPYGEQVVVISAGSEHQETPGCVALTLASAPVETSPDLEVEDDDDAPSGRSTSNERHRLISQTRRHSRSGSLGRGEGWDILVASCASVASRPLLVHRIPLSPDGSTLDFPSTDYSVRTSTQHVPSSVASLHFNPSLPGDEKNCRLLVSETKGTVRVLDCLLTGISTQLSCLVSLYPSLQASASGRGSRKHLLDAQWLLGGKAILALFEDGGWGIWDLEGYGPKPHSGTLAAQIPTMGSFFAFAIKGQVNGGASTHKVDDVNLVVKEGPKAVKLAPTTPSTRRMRQENLFSGPQSPTGRPLGGGISVIPSEDPQAVDEAALLWHNDNIVVIPSLRTDWTNKVKGSGNLFGKGAKGEARIIGSVSLRGERRTGVALLPASCNSTDNNSAEPPVLITGETRFVVITTPSSSGQQAALRDPVSPRSDKRLLEQGDLDLDGMDRVLSNMNDKT